jgi:6-pyruvoyltetrahydropterin/6-carboxytetrahydropterin synthase
MLVDFLDVKALMKQIMQRIDHQNLNEVTPFDEEKNPSAENIAEYFYNHMSEGLKDVPVPVRVSAVKVWETDIQSATYRP